MLDPTISSDLAAPQHAEDEQVELTKRLSLGAAQGRYGYIIYGGIIFAGLLLGLKIFFAKKSERYGVIDYFLDRCYLWSVILLMLLAAFATVALAIVLDAAVRFHSVAKSIQEIVARSGPEAMAMSSNITGAIGKKYNMSKLHNHSSQEFDHLNHSGGTQL